MPPRYSGPEAGAGAHGLVTPTEVRDCTSGEIFATYKVKGKYSLCKVLLEIEPKPVTCEKQRAGSGNWQFTGKDTQVAFKRAAARRTRACTQLGDAGSLRVGPRRRGAASAAPSPAGSRQQLWPPSFRCLRRCQPVPAALGQGSGEVRHARQLPAQGGRPQRPRGSRSSRRRPAGRAHGERGGHGARGGGSGWLPGLRTGLRVGGVRQGAAGPRAPEVGNKGPQVSQLRGTRVCVWTRGQLRPKTRTGK